MCAPLSCANAEATCAGETVTSNLSKIWLGLRDGVLELSGGVRWVLPRVCQSLNSGETVCQDSHSLRVWVER